MHPLSVSLLRHSFTMSKGEYKPLAEVKRAYLKAGTELKKNEPLRTGVALMQQMDLKKFKDALSELSSLRTGRPKKEKQALR